MPYFAEPKILLIHIPKTGGTSVEQYFSRKYNIPLDPNCIYFRYYQNTIQQSINQCRLQWRKRINDIIEREKQSLINASKQKRQNWKNKQNTNTEIVESSIVKPDPIIEQKELTNQDKWQTIKQELSEFRTFNKLKLARDLMHSLHHCTWSELKLYKDILFNNSTAQIAIETEKSNRNGNRIITIVRNPYDRIISELLFIRCFGTENVNPQLVFQQLKKYLEHPSTFDNHKLPQYLYLTDDNGNFPEDIIILKTETLTEQMHEMGYVDFYEKSLSHKIVGQKSKQTVENNCKYRSFLNKRSIELINNYYDKDFELFGYTKIRELREPTVPL